MHSMDRIAFILCGFGVAAGIAGAVIGLCFLAGVIEVTLR